jgi:hypothetical protein
MVLDRSELITAALLGTDRRPPTFLGEAADGEPAQVLLAYAARSAVAQRAGAPLSRLPSPPMGPRGQPPTAPAAAEELLTRLLNRPMVELLNLWLRAAAERGLSTGPGHWTTLATVASRRTDLDRTALARVLGPRGVWFCAQNPQWQRLAGVLGQADPVATGSPAQAAGGVPIVDAASVEADPDLIFEVPDPWPAALVEVAVSIIGSGSLRRGGSGYAVAVGLRLPLAQARRVQDVTDRLRRDDHQRMIFDRATRDALISLERTLELRLEIAQVFTPDHDQQEMS